MIIIDSDDEDEEDETVVGFMASHIDNKMELIKKQLANSIQRALK